MNPINIDYQQICEVELVYHSKVKPSERLTIKTSQDAYKLLYQTWNKGKIELVEQFKVVLLNNACRVLGILTASNGSVKASFVDGRTIFQAALKANATKIILAHNHPAGTLKPSTPDEAITKQMVAMGKILDVEVIEHIIVTSEGYYSFSDNHILN